jgi:hypothetical protein
MSGALEEFTETFDKFRETYDKCNSLITEGTELEIRDQSMVSCRIIESF